MKTTRSIRHLLLACLAAGSTLVNAQTAISSTPLPEAVRVAASDNFQASRSGRYLVVELRRPHRVLSTSPRNGGQSDTVRYLVNHQSMEAAGDMARHDYITGMTEEEYQDVVAAELHIDSRQMAMMGTAANLNYLAHVAREFRALRVDVFVTAGVEGNATRAGDPANWYESDKGSEYTGVHGTINTIVLVNQPLTAGAQARAIITMVEAKSAALAELAVPSRASRHLATGTGTDQYIVAAALQGSLKPLHGAQSHTKLGELIGDAVRSATLEALRWQNGLEPSYTRNVDRALGRFGLTEKELLSRLQKSLPAKSYDLLVANLRGITYEPRVAAAAYAYAAVLDRIDYGTLPRALAGEVLRDQAANVAVSLSLKPARWSEFWSQVDVNQDDLVQPFVQGLQMGWQARWASEK